jgi:hypothetical protein
MPGGGSDNIDVLMQMRQVQEQSLYQEIMDVFSLMAYDQLWECFG